MTSRRIPQDELWETYEPVESEDGSMIWDYLPGLDVAAENVWTVIEGDDGEIRVQAGIQMTNEYGYAVTLKPWVTGEESASGAATARRPRRGTSEHPEGRFVSRPRGGLDLPEDAVPLLKMLLGPDHPVVTHLVEGRQAFPDSLRFLGR